jgi:tetratricopeptide (TPR) repeat protein
MLVHSGGQQETRTLLYIIPAQRMAIAIGSNFEGSNPGTYVERLFQLLTGAPVEMNLYSRDKLKNATLEAVKLTFDYGMASFERSRKLSASDQEIAEAFAEFNAAVDSETVKANPQEVMAKVRQGVHPVSKHAFTKVGAYMAQRLSMKSALDSYPVKGGLAFFEDYFALTRTDASVPREMRFKESFETMVTGMSRDWSRSNTAYMRQLWLLPDSDLDVLAKTMRQTFSGVSVYPNLVDDLFSVTRQFVLQGENAGALKAGRLAVEFYPEHPQAQFMAGFGSLLNNDHAGAVAAFKKSSSINPGGPSSAGSLNNVAYQLAGVGKVDHALAVLDVAIQLYPKEANLYDSTGEFLLRKGEKAKALELYKKALEINPDYPNAAAAKEIVTKLSNELSAKVTK